MPKIRILPMLLLKNGRLVKGRNFTDYRDVGNPVTTGRNYNAQKVDGLIFLDINSNKESHEKFMKILSDVAMECFVPLTVGGGVATIEDFKTFLRNGADKVSINTAAFTQPELIQEASALFGSQCVVVSVDYRRDTDGNPIVYTESGTKNTGVNAFDHIQNCVQLGAGEILLTSIDHEGAMNGYDLDFIQEVTKSIQIPVIASGGVGKLKDFSDVLEQTEAEAVSAGSIFHFTDQSPIKARFYLHSEGFNVRNL